METAAPFPQSVYYSFIHSFTVDEHLYGGFGTSQDRIYGDMFCMCIDIGYVSTGENKRVQ
jgi:hypothetical protein